MSYDRQRIMIKHPEVQAYEMHYPQVSADVIDHICNQLEMGITPERWNVHGRVSIILARLMTRGTYQEKFEMMLWELSDSAKESL